jgi:hypothetical protein
VAIIRPVQLVRPAAEIRTHLVGGTVYVPLWSNRSSGTTLCRDAERYVYVVKNSLQYEPVDTLHQFSLCIISLLTLKMGLPVSQNLILANNC